MDIPFWSDRFLTFARSIAGDPAHDLSHLERVVSTALAFAISEGALLEVILPAAWLHDCVAVPKDSPERHRASLLSVARAIEFLGEAGYPAVFFDAIEHCIEAHSFSGGIAPRTLEARIIQDADRLDALGAIGIARCFSVGGSLGREFYAEHDPFCQSREPDDSRFTVDHFFRKLFRIAGTMQTSSGRDEARRRATFMRAYLDQLASEIPAATSEREAGETR